MTVMTTPYWMRLLHGKQAPTPIGTAWDGTRLSPLLTYRSDHRTISYAVPADGHRLYMRTRPATDTQRALIRRRLRTNLAAITRAVLVPLVAALGLLIGPNVLNAIGGLIADLTQSESATVRPLPLPFTGPVVAALLLASVALALNRYRAYLKARAEIIDDAIEKLPA